MPDPARHPAPGYTLLELLLVVAIVAIVATIVVGGGFLRGDARIGQEGRRLALVLNAWCESAAEADLELGLHLAPRHYAVLLPDPNGWLPGTESVFRPHALPEGQSLRVWLGDESLALADEDDGDPTLYCADPEEAPPLRVELLQGSDRRGAVARHDGSWQWQEGEG